MRSFFHGALTRIEVYSYDAQDRLVKIDYLTRGEELFVEYGPNNKPSKFKRYEIRSGNLYLASEKIFSYDSLDRLKIINVGASFYEYVYDSLGRVDKKLYNPGGPNNLSSVNENYIWGPDHIEKIEVPFSDPSRGLRYESSYTYDMSCNPFKSQASSLEFPVLWDDNNLKSSLFTDNTGLIDLICYDCQYQYEYNSRGFPTKRTSNFGFEACYTYK